MGIQFTSTGVLFQRDFIAFGGCHCTCVTPGGPDVPPPDPSNHCIDCPSLLNCASCGPCTPARFLLTIPDAVLATACFDCSASGLKVVSGSLTGPFLLQQVPDDPCRWRYQADNSAVLVLGRYTGASCSTGDTSSNLLIELARTPLGYTLTANVLFDDNASIVLFSGFLGQTGDGCNESFTIPGDATAFFCLDRAGYGGTAHLSVCPVKPPLCDDSDSADPCLDNLLVSGLVFPSDCSLCDDSGDPDQAVWDTTLARTSAALWDSATGLRINNCYVLTASLAFIDASTAEGDAITYPNGCGYYFSVKGTDPQPIVTYYRNSADPTGVYQQAYSNCDTSVWPFQVTVSRSVTPGCEPGPCNLWPSAIVARIVDNEIGEIAGASLSGDHALTLDETSWSYRGTISSAGVNLVLSCSAQGWRFETIMTSISCTDAHLGGFDSDGPTKGVYAYVEGGCGSYDEVTVEIL